MTLSIYMKLILLHISLLDMWLFTIGVISLIWMVHVIHQNKPKLYKNEFLHASIKHFTLFGRNLVGVRNVGEYLVFVLIVVVIISGWIAEVLSYLVEVFNFQTKYFDYITDALLLNMGWKNDGLFAYLSSIDKSRRGDVTAGVLLFIFKPYGLHSSKCYRSDM